MPQLTTMKLSEIKIEAQARKSFDEEELRGLGESIKRHGLLQPLLVRKDGVLLAGERRHRAMLLMGIKEAQVIVTDRVLSDSEVRLIQLTENMHRADLSGFEKWLACAELMCMNPGWQQKDLAEHLHISEKMVTVNLSPSKCIPAWQEALKEGKVGISDVYCASKLPEADQAPFLALKLSAPNGKPLSRNELEQAGRKKRGRPASGQPEATVAKGKFPLPKAVVQITGDGLTISTVIDVLSDLLKEAKAGHAQGMDIRALTALLVARSKDKTKAKA